MVGSPDEGVAWLQKAAKRISRKQNILGELAQQLEETHDGSQISEASSGGKSVMTAT